MVSNATNTVHRVCVLSAIFSWTYDWFDTNKKESIKVDYEKLIKLLGISGASKNAAKFITDSI